MKLKFVFLVTYDDSWLALTRYYAEIDIKMYSEESAKLRFPKRSFLTFVTSGTDENWWKISIEHLKKKRIVLSQLLFDIIECLLARKYQLVTVGYESTVKILKMHGFRIQRLTGHS